MSELQYCAHIDMGALGRVWHTVALEVTCHSSGVTCHSSGSHSSSSHVLRITPVNCAATRATCHVSLQIIVPQPVPSIDAFIIGLQNQYSNNKVVHYVFWNNYIIPAELAYYYYYYYYYYY